MTGTDLVKPVLADARVLVVESGEDDSALLTALLRLRGFDARAARTGKQALSAAASTRPHVVVIDLDLPDADGCEIIRRLRERANPPEVVVVTGHTALGHRRAATAAGAAAYLLKPADPDKLVNLIRELGPSSPLPSKHKLRQSRLVLAGLAQGERGMIITIDGYAGSGKSTAARVLAAELGYELMNTGAMYRATAFALRRLGIDLDAEPRDERAIAAAVAGYHFDMTDTRIWLNGEDLTDFIYSEAMGQAASRVGTFAEVRARLKDEQRRIADQRDIICEGRDQGTAVFPEAPVKFFFTATAETRARRRAEQLGIDPDRQPEAFADLVQQIIARDRQDERRAIDPLQQAPDATVIDTSELSPDQVLARMVEVVERCRLTR